MVMDWLLCGTAYFPLFCSRSHTFFLNSQLSTLFPCTFSPCGFSAKFHSTRQLEESMQVQADSDIGSIMSPSSVDVDGVLAFDIPSPRPRGRPKKKRGR